MILSSTIKTLIGGTPPSNNEVGWFDLDGPFLALFGLRFLVGLGEVALTGGVGISGGITADIGGVGKGPIPGVPGTRSSTNGFSPMTKLVSDFTTYLEEDSDGLCYLSLLLERS